jgi:uncharacterized coiled-coil protein SlyX
MNGLTCDATLTEIQLAGLWAEHDRLRKQIEALDRRFRRVNDQLMAHIMATWKDS